MKPLCAVEGCGRPVRELMWCHSHYEWWRRNGRSVLPSQPILTDPVDRFWAKVEKRDDGCWIWQGATGGTGRYGTFAGKGAKARPAHRWAYEQFVGPIPQGLELDHLCRVTLCVNPAHLEPVTHRENVLRGESLQAKNARKTHCIRGHEFGLPDEKNRRQCWECMALRNEARRKRAA